MRLAFDARETSHMSAGMLLYARKLQAWLPAVAPDITLLRLGHGDNFDLAEQLALPWQIARGGADLAHVPTPFVPVWMPVPYVVTIHDLIDLEFPAYAKGKVGPYYRAIVGPALRRARAVITDDEMTVGLLERFLRVNPARVSVIPLGCDAPPRLGPRRTMRPRPYILYAGNHRPHKNLATLYAAWSGLGSGFPLDLVLTGHPCVSDLPTREGSEVVVLGDVPDEELADWYAGALAYVHPALREGFGLPMLEAMRAGTLVIAAENSLPRRLAPYARSFPATDVSELRAALSELLADPGGARARGEIGRAGTAELTWERVARATAEVYRRSAS